MGAEAGMRSRCPRRRQPRNFDDRPIPVRKNEAIHDAAIDGLNTPMHKPPAATKGGRVGGIACSYGSLRCRPRNGGSTEPAHGEGGGTNLGATADRASRGDERDFRKNEAIHARVNKGRKWQQARAGGTGEVRRMCGPRSPGAADAVSSANAQATASTVVTLQGLLTIV